MKLEDVELERLRAVFELFCCYDIDKFNGDIGKVVSDMKLWYDKAKIKHDHEWKFGKSDMSGLWEECWICKKERRGQSSL